MKRKLDKYIDIHRDTSAIDKYTESQFREVPNVIRNVYNTLKLEGNTLEEADMLSIFEGNFTVEDVTEKLNLEDSVGVQNMLMAHEHLYQNLNSRIITTEFILELHSIICKGLDNKDLGIVAGEYRKRDCHTKRRDGSIKIYTSPDYIEQFLDSHIDTYNKERIKTVSVICQFNLDFLSVHPFLDGNGRVSRILLNHSLITEGYPPITVSPEYKDRYLESLKVYDINGDPTEFIGLISHFLIMAYDKIEQQTKLHHNI